MYGIRQPGACLSNNGRRLGPLFVSNWLIPRTFEARW